MNHISLENLPRLNFCLRRLTGRSECFAKRTKRAMVAAKTDLFSGLNVNSISKAESAHRGDRHPKNSNSHKTVPFQCDQEQRPNKKTAALIRRRFSVSRGEFCSVISHCTSNQKFSSLIQGTLPLHLVGCQNSFLESFLMLAGEYQIRSPSAITIRASER